MADIRTELQTKSMNGFQIFVVAVMVLLNGMDGYDVLAMNFAAPLVGADFAIGEGLLGWLMSASLIGMMIGSLAIAPFADAFGRKKLILVALVVDGVGLFFSALSSSPVELFIWRLVTGLGIGAMLAAVASMTAEFANARQRSLCVSIMAIGYPAGAMLGGLGASALVGATGTWEPIFWLGFVVTAASLPIVLILPESPEFLLSKRPKNALARMNALLPKLGMEPVSELPPEVHGEKDAKVYSVLFRNHLRSLILITAAYFLFAATLYFPLNWLTYMLTQSGLSPEMGISGSVLMNGFGAVGGALFGVVAGKWGGLRNTVPAFMVLSVVALVAFGFMPSLALMLIAGAVIGFGLIGTVSGLYSTYPVIFPPTVRTTGSGIVIGVGRIGGIISPPLIGYMIEGGVARPIYCILAALPLVGAIFLLRAINELKTPRARGEVAADAVH